MKRFYTLIVFIWISSVGYSQTVPGFSLQDISRGQAFELTKYADQKGVVLIFHSNHCAYSKRYIERIKRLEAEFATSGIVFALINSNDGTMVKEDSAPGIDAFIKSSNIRFSYLVDSAQEVKNLLQAQRTPEVVVLQPQAGQFKIFYRGALDDNPQGLRDTNHQFLRDALLSLSKNELPAIELTKPVGCLIK